MRYVTSFGPQGYEVYGRRFLETYCEHMSHPLTVYVEAPCDFRHELITYKNLVDVPGCQDFLNKLVFPAMHGKMWSGQYDYRFAVAKFCRKQFAQADAALDEMAHGGDWLVWIDADIELGAPLPDPVDGPFMYYLGRPEWHSCASYVAWDLRKPASKEWWTKLQMLYLSGSLFALPEWHDSYVNDWLREGMKVSAINLAAPYAAQLKGPANVFDVVFAGSHHKKGGLKFREAKQRRAG